MNFYQHPKHSKTNAIICGSYSIIVYHREKKTHYQHNHYQHNIYYHYTINESSKKRTNILHMSTPQNITHNNNPLNTIHKYLSLAHPTYKH